jgi:hypothetical protein
MPTADTFWWGCLGGLAAYTLVFVLPEVRHLAETGRFATTFTPGRVTGLVLLVFLYVAMAGLAAVLVGDADQPKQAIAYGMGWETLLKGVSTAAAAVTAPKLVA